MRRLQAVLSVLLLAFAVPSFAQSVVDSLHIDVKLADDGSATVTEVWHIDVLDDITEWYLVADNLDGMTLSNLRVKDERGFDYENEGEWDVDRSRSAKAGKCGVVTKSRGYELCWGVGSSGPHVYTVSYDFTGLVRGHADMDGFNHMFVARDLGSSPQHVSLRIWKPGSILTSENTRVWGFGYEGEIHVLDGAVKAWSTEPFVKRSAMIALVGFEKGIFTPSLVEDRTFEDVKAQAVEGSDYEDDSEDGSGFFALLMAGMAALFGFVGIRSAIRKRKRKKELLGGGKKEVKWFRDVPVDGNLRDASNILTLFSGNPKTEREHLIGAYIMRLFYRGAFELVPTASDKPDFRIADFTVPADEATSQDTNLEFDLFNFFKEAAGGDSILQQKELRRWANRNGERLYNWQQKIPNGETIWSETPERVQQVFGLKKFLDDFTLIDDRGVTEVKLWNNYLVFASLYGIADKVYKDFKKVCPEYFTLSREAAMMQDVTPVVLWNTIGNTSRYFNSAACNYASKSTSSSSRWGGGGGMSSWGGGGGFSGGGSGGGGR